MYVSEEIDPKTGPPFLPLRIHQDTLDQNTVISNVP